MGRWFRCRRIVPTVVPLHPSHQLEELPPFMGAIGKQWSAARGQKEAQCCWCGRVVRLAQMELVCGLGEVWN